MARLIDADELKRYIDNCDFCDRCPDAAPRCQIDCEMPDFLTKRWKRVIDAQHTVDAEPVRHGKWIRKGLLYHCSACGYGAFNSDFVFGARYCPTCGARMDERKE